MCVYVYVCGKCEWKIEVVTAFLCIYTPFAASVLNEFYKNNIPSSSILLLLQFDLILRSINEAISSFQIEFFHGIRAAVDSDHISCKEDNNGYRKNRSK